MSIEQVLQKSVTNKSEANQQAKSQITEPIHSSEPRAKKQTDHVQGTGNGEDLNSKTALKSGHDETKQQQTSLEDEQHSTEQQASTSAESARLQELALTHVRTKKRLKELEKKLQERDSMVSEFEEFKKSMEEDKYSFARDKLGLNYEEWTDRILNGDSSEEKTELQVVMERLQTLEKMEEERAAKLEAEKAEAEKAAQKQKYQAALEWAQNYVAEDERFAITNALGRSDLIVNEFWRHYQEYGESPSEEAIATKVEDHLTNVMKAQLQKLKAMPKFRELFDAISVEDNTDGAHEFNNEDTYGGVEKTRLSLEEQRNTSNRSQQNQQTKPKKTQEKLTTLSNKHSAVSKTTTKPIRGTAQERAAFERMAAVLQSGFNKER